MSFIITSPSNRGSLIQSYPIPSPPRAARPCEDLVEQNWCVLVSIPKRHQPNALHILASQVISCLPSSSPWSEIGYLTTWNSLFGLKFETCATVWDVLFELYPRSKVFFAACPSPLQLNGLHGQLMTEQKILVQWLNKLNWLPVFWHFLPFLPCANIPNYFWNPWAAIYSWSPSQSASATLELRCCPKNKRVPCNDVLNK